jgi:ribosomal protein S6--L-glutamate ligase
MESAMKIVILSRSASIPSTQRLIEEAKARGHRVRVCNPLEVQLHLDGRSANVYWRGRILPRCDAVIPRIAQSISHYGLAVVNQFEMRRTPLLNSAQAIAQARNKMRSLQLLSAHGIDIPATVVARQASELKSMVRLLGGVPVLVKLIQGGDRRGIMVCETLQSLEAALEAILGLGQQLIVQQYVKGTGQDVRAFVVAGEVVAAVRRRPRVGRLAHTLNLGARLEKIELTAEQRRAAVGASRLMKLEVAAVDLLDVRGSPKVFEVNASPAIVEMEAATGVNLAARIIERAEGLVAQRKRKLAAPGTRERRGVKVAAKRMQQERP